MHRMEERSISLHIPFMSACKVKVKEALLGNIAELWAALQQQCCHVMWYNVYSVCEGTQEKQGKPIHLSTDRHRSRSVLVQIDHCL